MAAHFVTICSKKVRYGRKGQSAGTWHIIFSKTGFTWVTKSSVFTTVCVTFVLPFD